MKALHPASIAGFSEGLSVEETWELLSDGDVHRQAEVFPFFSAEKEVELVEGVGRARMSKLLQAMSQWATLGKAVNTPIGARKSSRHFASFRNAYWLWQSSQR